MFEKISDKIRIAIYKQKNNNDSLEETEYELIGHYNTLERLKEDCNRGKIDLIITSNLTAFSGNISDSLRFIWGMQLLSPPVHVRLDDVGVDTREPQSLLYCMVFHYTLEEKSNQRI